MGTIEQLDNLSPDQRRLVELWLRREQAAPPDPPQSTEIAPRRATDTTVLSFAQQRLWVLYQLDPGSPAYNLRTLVRLVGQLDATLMERSLNAIVQRHETLRTTFVLEDGQPQQVIAPSWPITLPLVALDHLPPAEREAQIMALALVETEQPFDLERGPLWRALLLRVAPDEHVLVLTMHHIISDGWSQGVQLRELIALYAAFAQGQPAPLPPLPIQYADYALWQQQAFQTSLLDKQLTYWKTQLGHTPHVLDLPTDRPRPPMTTYRGAWDYYTLSAATLDQIKALSRREGVTLFMTLLAAFDVLLYRYTGQTDLVVGTPVAGRNRSEVEGLIGCFVNMLALRTQLDGDPTFRELLGRVRGVTLAAYANQELPFEKLVEEIKLPRDMSRNPVFQVMLALQNAPMPSLVGPDLRVLPLEVTSTTSTLDLSLYVREVEHELLIRVEYSTDLFDAATIQRLMGHFHTLLEAVIAAPDQRISTVPLLSVDEQHELLVAWNDSHVAYPLERSLNALFAAQVARTPEALAVVDGVEQLSYAALNRRANQLAHHLRSLGVQPETLVGICLDRSVAMVVAMLGTLKAGAAYLPLDPAYPAERLQFMLDDTQVRVVLTQTPYRHALPATNGPDQPELPLQIICLDTADDVLARESAENPLVAVSPDQLAYVLYTSGSTGQPKGVLGLHGGMLNRLHWMWQRYPFTAHDVACHKSSLNFVDSVWEVFGPLLRGVPLVEIPDAAVKDLHQLVDTLAQHRVTRTVLVPSLLHALLVSFPDLAQRLPHLRLWTNSGEAITVELAQRFHARLPQATLLNLYGSSEVAADALWHEIMPGQALYSVPIGRPLDNLQVYLLDSAFNPVPIGVAGEIYVGGVGLARGYLDRPALTAERFVPHPFAASPGARLYRTGDLARYRSDGTVEYLGRIDHQIKLRGFRIELGEIEAVLQRHPAVAAAAAVVRDDPTGDKRLVAYVVSAEPGSTHQELGGAPISGQRTADTSSTDDAPSSAPGSEALRAFLKETLPDYMIPSVFVTLPALPLTPNGKVDRRALPDLDLNKAVQSKTMVPPRTPVEEVLADLWTTLLGLERIGVYDNFFDLGGHSLKAAQLIVRTREAFKVDLPVRSLFQATTVAAMAELIIAREARPGQTEKIAQVLMRIRSMSAEDRQKVLERKRTANSQS